MKDFIISTDSTADLPNDYLEQHHIFIHPLYYNLNGEIYGGEIDLEPKDFYARMRKGQMPSTMATNPDFIQKSFKSQLDAGLDILHISFSSALSSSHSNACMIANELRDENPDAKIIVIDSLCASMGQGLLVHYAVMLKEAGKSIDEITSWLEENKLHLCHQFTVDDLHHLHRGGRVSKTAAIIGSIINVKPVLHVDNTGHLAPLSNVRGRKKALMTLVDNMAGKIDGYQNDIIFISHGDCLDDAEYVANMIRERFGIQKFLINFVCPTIGAHSGPGTIALFFLGNER